MINTVLCTTEKPRCSQISKDLRKKLKLHKCLFGTNYEMRDLGWALALLLSYFKIFSKMLNLSDAKCSHLCYHSYRAENTHDFVQCLGQNRFSKVSVVTP